jgi:Mn2+/Fe2+ NRAMP family transporter
LQRTGRPDERAILRTRRFSDGTSASQIRDTFIPSWPRNHDAWENLVAVLGTTISPYLFFWQASQEVEEEKVMGRRLLVQRQGATSKEIVDRKLDVGDRDRPAQELHHQH